MLYFWAMAAITLQVPDDMARRFRGRESELSRAVEMGLRELNADAQRGYEGAAGVLEFLANLPNPDEILNLRPSAWLSARIADLLEINRTEGLSPEEEDEWEQYQYLEHLVRMAKTKACSKLGITSANG
jgi:hypothetical protein